MAQEDENETFVLEQTLFQEKPVWFYRIPPGQISTRSPRADDWDHENPFLTGSLRMVQKGDDCFLQLFEPLPSEKAAQAAAAAAVATSTTTATAAGTPGTQPTAPMETSSFTDENGKPTLFAQSPVVITKDLPLEIYVQDCADSSRYFMVTVEDEASKRRAYVGVGFPQRPSAFNFKAALQDYVRYRHRQMEAENMAAASSATTNDSDADSTAAETRSHDYSLPEGATIRINLKTHSAAIEKQEHTPEKPKTTGPVAFAPLIPPPPAGGFSFPPPPSAQTSAMSSTTTVTATSQAVSDDDWGDFTSA
jgi:hypothetical protein